MQATLTSLPLPEAQTIAVAVVMLLAGIAVPTRYGIERIEGFGRSMASLLPYKPPPGMDAEQAMRRAVFGRGSSPTDADAEEIEEQPANGEGGSE